MSKKLIIGIIAVIVLAGAGIAAFAFMGHKKDNHTESNTNNPAQEDTTQGGNMSDRKILVAYYSAQNHTRAVAEQIAQNLNADIFEIVPAEVYTAADLDWTNDNSRVSREHNDESLRNVALTTTQVPNWSEYDTVLLGCPIWWGIAAWPVDNFVRENNFTGKTVIPFCTSTSSGLGQSGQLLAELAGTGDWQAGHRFSSNPSSNDIKSWTDSL